MTADAPLSQTDSVRITDVNGAGGSADKAMAGVASDTYAPGSNIDWKNLSNVDSVSTTNNLFKLHAVSFTDGAAHDGASENPAETVTSDTPSSPSGSEKQPVWPSVVEIETPRTFTDASGKSSPGLIIGSGFIVNEGNGDQYVVTAGHVVTNASGPIEVSVPGVDNKTAKLVGYDPSTDTSILKLSGEPIPDVGLNITPNEAIPAGASIGTTGFPGGSLDASEHQLTYAGTKNLKSVATNSVRSMIVGIGMSEEGASGSPAYLNSDGNVVGIVTEVNSGPFTKTKTYITPISAAQALIDAQNPDNPDYLKNQLETDLVSWFPVADQTSAPGQQ